MPSADGRAKNLLGSASRLVRMLGRDLDGDDLGEIGGVARYLAIRQRAKIEQAVELVLSNEPYSRHSAMMIGAGVGRFVVGDLARSRNCDHRNFDALIGCRADIGLAATVAAPAVAAAKLARMTV